MAVALINRKIILALASLLLAVTLCLAAPAAYALGAAESFAEGNRLFRENLYWAALLRYQQASEAGLDTPILHYNIGVANYKAGQFSRAHQSLLKASRSPKLRVRSHYNLGLNAYAAGMNEEALRWFRRARDQQENARLRKAAGKAIARIRAPERELVSLRVSAAQKVKAKELTQLEFYARIGTGYDDNVYRSPAASYVDLSRRNQAVNVDPVINAGMYHPLRIGARFSINSFEHESFYGAYRMSGNFHSDDALKNADQYSHELALGSEHRRREENRESVILSAFTVAQHEELYFDPDDGTERTRNGVSIADRLSYVRIGPQIEARQSWRRFSIKLQGKAQLWNYTRAAQVPEYDHEYFRIGGSLQYRFFRSSLLRLSAASYRRNYTDRPSYDLDGTLSIGNPTVGYDYLDLGLEVRQRISKMLWFGVSYLRSARTDGYVGYNDYTRNSYGAEVRMRLGRRFQMAAEADYRVYDYANAFAYNNPLVGRKELDTLRGSARASFNFRSNLTLVGEYAFQQTASNDARIAYDRSQYSLSLQWNYD